MAELSTVNQPLITHHITVLAGLFFFGVSYAAIVRTVRRRNPNHGFTAFWVVGGNLVIVVAFGLLAGVQAAALLFFCMAAAGLPMLVEYIDHWLTATATGANDAKLEL
jgi:hypothetical protein